MNRMEQLHRAAEVAASIAHRTLCGRLGDPQSAEAAVRELRFELTEHLARYIHRPVRHAVADLVDDARAEEANVRQGLYEAAEEGEDYVPLATRLRRELVQAIEELDELEGHRCSWDEEPETGRVYCTVCGADGLA